VSHVRFGVPKGWGVLGFGVRGASRHSPQKEGPRRVRPFSRLGFVAGRSCRSRPGRRAFEGLQKGVVIDVRARARAGPTQARSVLAGTDHVWREQPHPTQEPASPARPGSRWRPPRGANSPLNLRTKPARARAGPTQAHSVLAGTDHVWREQPHPNTRTGEPGAGWSQTRTTRGAHRDLIPNMKPHPRT
jgi:hypothetical protein